MHTFLFLNNLILVLALLQGNANSAASVAASLPAESGDAEVNAEPRNLTVSLKTATEAMITFRADHDEELTTLDTTGKEIPHLVLNRNGVPTPGFERTLIVALENIEVPATGAYAQLIIETQHGDPDVGGGRTNRIQVWEETRFLPFYAESEQLRALDFRIVFRRTFNHLQREHRTPTDYFRYQVRLLDTQGNILTEFSDDYAFLMENEWRVPLPKVLEGTSGAAPNELVLYYYDMIPFQTDLRDPYTQIAQSDVERYIQTKLIPAMVHAFEVQTNVWGFPWYEEWSNYRTEEDPKSLSVALVEYGTWYHGAAPSLGHAMISIRVDGSFSEYSDLTDGIMSVFHHELFHNQQRNISLHFGSKGNLHGQEEAWKVFSEGTAVLASSVGQPLVQFEQTVRPRSYLKRANAFIGGEDVFGGGLNKSYKEIPYHTSLYWRFLYEKCGGVTNGIEDPAAGMSVIRNALETLYKGEIVNINQSSEVASALPRVLDTALQATPSCPFRSYQESLVHFARAIFQLRLEDGRCNSSDQPASCGFYDPSRLYTVPDADDFLAAAGSTWINGSIPSSFGVDLVELTLDPAVNGKSLKIFIRAVSTPQDVFLFELHGIRINDSEPGMERLLSPAGGFGSTHTENGQLALEVSSLDLEAYNGLALILLRTDPYEDTDGSGHYSIQILVE